MPTPVELSELLPKAIIEANLKADRRRYDQVMRHNSLMASWRRFKSDTLPLLYVYVFAGVAVAALAGITIYIVRGCV